MTSCLIYFGTSEGQTAKIAGAIAEHLRVRGIEVRVVQEPEPADPAEFDAVIVGDSIHIGRYHKGVIRFIEANRDTLGPKPSWFFSVSMSAASGSEKGLRETQAVVDQMIETTGWRPERVAIFGGALKYTKYGVLKRWLMKRISASSGGTTDTTRDHEFTDWHSVESFAEAFAIEARGAAAERDASTRSD